VTGGAASAAQKPTRDADRDRHRGDDVSDLPETADVVVVGGGIAGVSTAFFLGEAGVRSVVVLERGTIGGGATGRAAGVMTLQAAREPELRFQVESLAVHERLREELGTDLTPVGSLLLWTVEEADAARRRAAMHEAAGVRLEILEPDELRYRFPDLTADDVAVATFSARDPWATPLATVERLADAARARGAIIREGCEVTGLELEGERVRGVAVRDGTIATPTVVNAAGAWARSLAAPAGLRIPVAARKRQVFVLDAAGTDPAAGPFIEEEARDFYCMKRPDGVIMVCGQPPGEAYDTAAEWGYLDDALAPTIRRYPALRHARVTDAWAGVRAVTPDGGPILGTMPAVPGYVMAGGLGAQGFARGPLVGRLVSELITTGRASLDLSAYRPDRFARAGRGR